MQRSIGKDGNSAFNSKILLFGEYTLLEKPPALALPYGRFSGRWSFGAKNEHSQKLRQWAEYLQDGIKNDRLIGLEFDGVRFLNDLDGGLLFESTIPQGYRLGSSGALSAALYARYFSEKETTDSLTDLQRDLAYIEGFFHGTSSGLDPLVALLNKAVIVQQDQVQAIELERLDTVLQPFYLLDSGQERDIKQLMSQYHSLKVANAWRKSQLAELQTRVQAIVEKIMNGEAGTLDEHMAQLSALQFSFFNGFIPPAIQSVWERGLQGGSYYMKLCGGGGGGYFLVYIPKKSKHAAMHFLAGSDLLPLAL